MAFDSDSFREKFLNQLILGDSTTLLKEIPDNSVHAIVSDIPYGIGVEDWDVLHSNTNNAYLGASPAQIKAQSVFGKRGKPINGWSTADGPDPRKVDTGDLIRKQISG